MRSAAFFVFIAVMVLATCSGPEINPAPSLGESDIVVPAPHDEPAPTLSHRELEPKLPGPPFEAETFIHDAGFALDYPAGWTVNEAAIGPRGTQVQFLSAPGLAEVESLPDGATRLSATIYQWDPKNDLEAYAANWKTAWEASGFEVLSEEQLILELGLPAVQFIVKTPDAEVLFLVAALQDQYLVVSGEGNLELVKEIAGRVRPISNP